MKFLLYPKHITNKLTSGFSVAMESEIEFFYSLHCFHVLRGKLGFRIRASYIENASAPVVPSSVQLLRSKNMNMLFEKLYRSQTYQISWKSVIFLVAMILSPCSSSPLVYLTLYNHQALTFSKTRPCVWMLRRTLLFPLCASRFWCCMWHKQFSSPGASALRSFFVRGLCLRLSFLDSLARAPYCKWDEALGNSFVVTQRVWIR